MKKRSKFWGKEKKPTRSRDEKKVLNEVDTHKNTSAQFFEKTRAFQNQSTP